MIIYCSKALQKALNLKKADLLPAEDVQHQGDDLYHWHAHIAKVEGKNTIVVMNDKTRYVIILRNRLPRSQVSFVKLMEEAIPYTFEVEGYNSIDAMNYMANMGPIVFGAKGDRQITSNINLYMKEFAYMEKEVWDETDTVQAFVSHLKNYNICKRGKDYIVARDEMSDALDALHDGKVIPFPLLRL